MTFGSKDRFWFFLFLAAGAIIGGLLGNFLEASQFFGAGTAFLIHKYQVLNIPPVDVDLYIAKITFGFTFSPNLVAIIGMILALVILSASIKEAVMQVILASKSPRRKDLLVQVGMDSTCDGQLCGGSDGSPFSRRPWFVKMPLAKGESCGCVAPVPWLLHAGYGCR